jgi:hypothetical protein
MSATTSPERESFDDRALECPVCVSFLVEPLTLDCGHSFCRACLLQSTRLAPDGRCCPVCRSPVSIRDPATHACDARLGDRVRAAVAADLYAARVAADAATIAEVLESTARVLPIFACSPGTAVGRPVALHFYEPRYKTLVRRAWEGNRLFAFTDRPPRPGVDAVVVHIEQARFLRDGRANVVGVGVAAIVLRDVWVEDNTGGLSVTSMPRNPAWLPAPPARRTSAGADDQRCAAQRCACALM